MIKQYKIPTLLGLFLLIFGLVGSVVLIQQWTHLFGFAQTGVNPEQLKITNLSNNSFSVSWLTSKTTPGFVAYGKTTDLGSTAYDDRDKSSGQTNNYSTHHITLTSLEPSTKYYFKIGSGGKLYDGQGQPYTVTTAPTLTTTPPLADPAQGTVLQVNGQPLSDGLVYLSLSGVTPLSTLVKDSGKWVISLNNARAADLNQYAQYDRGAQIEEIFVHGGPSGVTSAITTTNNDNPVPEMVLGKTYDFRQTAALSPTSSETPTNAPSKFSVQPLVSPTASKEVTITNPTENEEITTQNPEFFGTGPAGKTIQIQVESPTSYTDQVMVDDQNSWNWTPPASLSPGEHKITITYLGKKIQRSFTVLAAQIDPAFVATPSGTITPKPTATPTIKKGTPTPTVRATPTTTLTLTPIPTVRNTPTSFLSSTPTPTLTRAVVKTSMPSTESGIPVSGNFTPTFTVFIIGLALVLVGFTLQWRWPHLK